jgi:hypothetical protein
MGTALVEIIGRRYVGFFFLKFQPIPMEKFDKIEII